MTKKLCVVVGVGPGNGAALARRFAAEGYAFSTAHVWTSTGHLAAVSQQSLAVFS